MFSAGRLQIQPGDIVGGGTGTISKTDTLIFDVPAGYYFAILTVITGGGTLPTIQYWLEQEITIFSRSVMCTIQDNGQITVDGVNFHGYMNQNINVKYDGTFTCTITPDGGFAILDVLVDGISIGTPAVVTILNVIIPHTVEVTFV